jgi:hypothetical protein
MTANPHRHRRSRYRATMATTFGGKPPTPALKPSIGQWPQQSNHVATIKNATQVSFGHLRQRVRMPHIRTDSTPATGPFEGKLDLID